MKELKSMVEFVLNRTSDLIKTENEDTKTKVLETISSHKSIYKYANFLSQKLELCMFVPCDEKGNVLEEPTELYQYTVQKLR